MPRRRKKVDPNKVPLEFEETPLHIVHRVVSPVFSADHPLTADVVALDPNTSVPWVSPQFAGPVTPGGRRRRRQPSRTQVTRARSHHGNQSEHVAPRTRHQKTKHYQSLQLVGGRSCVEISPLEELTIDTQDEVKRRSIRKSSDKQTVPQVPNTSFSKKENRPPLNISLDVPRAGVDELFTDDSSYSDSGTPRRKVSKTCAKKPRQKSRRNKHKGYNDSDNSLDVSQGNQGGSFCAGENLGTQKRPTPERQRSSKRLFEGNNEMDSSQPQHGEVHGHLGARTPLRTLQERRLKQRRHHESLSPASRASPCSSPPMPVDVGTPSGGQENLLFAPLLQTPVLTKLPADCRVLVYDTPEEDYGLSVKLRRRKRKQNKSLLK